jgi:hypothetical protein
MPMKKLITCILSLALLFSLSTPLITHASASDTCSSEEIAINDNYYITEENGTLIIKPSTSFRMGGGIGRCTVKNKTFSYSMTRSQAKAALKVTQIGEGSVKSLGTLLSTIVPGGIGIAIDLILNYIGGDTVYVSNLKTFINSGKSTAYFKFKTHCENRGYMYGDPMYDYVIDSVSMTY